MLLPLRCLWAKKKEIWSNRSMMSLSSAGMICFFLPTAYSAMKWLMRLRNTSAAAFFATEQHEAPSLVEALARALGGDRIEE